MGKDLNERVRLVEAMFWESADVVVKRTRSAISSEWGPVLICCTDVERNRKQVTLFSSNYVSGTDIVGSRVETS